MQMLYRYDSVCAYLLEFDRYIYSKHFSTHFLKEREGMNSRTSTLIFDFFFFLV
jgi:hypothetical protein